MSAVLHPILQVIYENEILHEVDWCSGKCHRMQKDADGKRSVNEMNFRGGI